MSMLGWIKSYEKRRHSNIRNRGGLSYENFQSSKYDFQNIPSTELKRIYIPELGMTVGSAISALKRSWKKYRWSKQDNEPTGDLSMRILTLQKGLGLEQSDFLIEEARQFGYTDSEINDEEVERRQEEYEWNNGLTTEELEAQKEEQLENGFATTEDEWSDEDRQALSDEIAAEKEVEW